MRRAFVESLVEIAEQDERTVLLTGDLGFNSVEPFAERYPDRFINVGVAEQSLVGVATGLAKAGYIPYCYSIATFMSLRPYEFIRNGPVAHRLPVRIVGIGGGFEYGAGGPTHHAVEDIAIMRALPGLRVLVPADDLQTAAIVKATHGLDGPAYLRIGKNDKTEVPGLDGRFELERLQVLDSTGAEIAILTTGSISPGVAAAATELAEQGISCDVAVIASVAPAPRDDIAEFCVDRELVVTVESHIRNGGIGSLVAETLSEVAAGTPVTRLGVGDVFSTRSGGQEYLHERHGISRERIVERVRQLYDSRSIDRLSVETVPAD